MLTSNVGPDYAAGLSSSDHREVSVGMAHNRSMRGACREPWTQLGSIGAIIHARQIHSPWPSMKLVDAR